MALYSKAEASSGAWWKNTNRTRLQMSPLRHCFEQHPMQERRSLCLHRQLLWPVKYYINITFLWDYMVDCRPEAEPRSTTLFEGWRYYLFDCILCFHFRQNFNIIFFYFFTHRKTFLMNVNCCYGIAKNTIKAAICFSNRTVRAKLSSSRHFYNVTLSI